MVDRPEQFVFDNPFLPFFSLTEKKKVLSIRNSNIFGKYLKWNANRIDSGHVICETTA